MFVELQSLNAKKKYDLEVGEKGEQIIWFCRLSFGI